MRSTIALAAVLAATGGAPLPPFPKPRLVGSKD